MNDEMGMGMSGGVRRRAERWPVVDEAAAKQAPARATQPIPAWLDDNAEDFGAPQATIDALVMSLGFQPMARLIADRPALRAAVIVEYREQCAELRRRLLYEEWHA